MNKHYFLFVLLLAFTAPLFSQDCYQPGGDISISSLEDPMPSQGLYHEPRWVSWPGTALILNLAGFAQAGPVLQIEARATRSLYIVPSLRYNYAGYASHRLMNGLDTDSRYLPGSFAAGLGLRQFFALQKKNRMVFVGLFGEYSIDKAEYNLGSRWESERERNAVNVIANFGYRWWFRKNFFIHVAVYAGMAFELKDESVYSVQGPYQGEVETDFKNTPFIGLIDFSLGWNL